MTGAARRRRRRCQWNRGRFRFRFAGTRPYALRPTFATINLARGENIKTVSVLLGHADASYTLDSTSGSSRPPRGAREPLRRQARPRTRGRREKA